jgi:hypothetical protein
MFPPQVVVFLFLIPMIFHLRRRKTKIANTMVTARAMPVIPPLDNLVDLLVTLGVALLGAIVG